ncbi:uncharacterized protein BYT42DRAFT_609677 [Radiomyces spectabilis]|uniref:uncharacterized protein n=1 Tax=Radiomyces spectabilis TaxID=64574 RepID=UPI002220B7C8|nr:uncharacterized protein BYT42DRAFT_609677 [Radiomyces spectabilis]KAI8393916.1 hypothetical protein BYT42DRAFT_609677 [Radiomyces spectabilis]
MDNAVIALRGYHSVADVRDAVAEYGRKFNIVLVDKRSKDRVIWFTCTHYGDCGIRKGNADDDAVEDQEAALKSRVKLE